MSHTDNQEAEKVKIGRRVTWIGFWSNVGLSVLKILAGIFGRSSAMVADGVHSASDLLTDLAVIIVIGVSRKKADSSHAYGHGKIETLVTFVIALFLGIVGIGIFADGVTRTIDSLKGVVIPQPGWIALCVAVLSIAIKEWLFRYTRSAARRVGSSAMEANAWHHRSDSFSSIATLIGVGGAMFLGVKWRILDPLAAIFVSFLIVLMSYKMCREVVLELLEAALPDEDRKRMEEIIRTTPGVEAFHNLRTRRNGNMKLADFHINLDPGLTIVQAHDIATDVENRLKKAFDPITVNIHMEPYNKTTPS